ncbi:MAG: DNA gyrase C-terminal beta-propeller domain-containing protein, partial [Synechocystis sp.]
INQQETLLVITDHGKAYGVKIQDIPPLELARIPLLDLLPKAAQRDGETVIFSGFLPVEDASDVLLLTQEGRIKRVGATEFNDLGNRGLSVIKLRDGDRLRFCHGLTAPDTGQNLVIATRNGRLLRFPLSLDLLPRSSRSAQGQPALRLRPTENLVGLLTLPPTASVFLLTQQGYGKRLSLNTVRLGNFGDLGTTVLQFTDKTDSLLLMTPASDTALTTISNQQTVTVIAAEQFQAWGKDGPGDSLLSLSPGDYLVGQLQGDGGA